MVPFADRNKNKEDAYSTFVMTNIFPQAPSLNKGHWSRLENYSRDLVKKDNELYIISGGLWTERKNC
jgi:endonuclease G